MTAEPQPIGVGISTVYEQFAFGTNDLDSQFLAYGTCVIPDPPAITVDPDALSTKLFPGEMDTQSLTITNIGDEELTFNILSDQLFGVPAGGTTAGTIPDLDLGPAGDPIVDNGIRLDRFEADRAASRTSKPDVSPFTVPLPHIFALSLLNEDFNSGFPAGWSALDNTG